MDNEVFLKRTAIEDYQYNEAMKTLRTNIQFSGTGIQVVMLTSSVPGEGKSETTFHLAASLAQLDKKVLLIERRYPQIDPCHTIPIGPES